MANYVPALTPRMATCCGPRTADLCTRMDSGDTRAIACSSGVQPGGGMGPATFCLAVRPGLKRFREEFEGEGVEAFAYMDDVSLGLMEFTANTVRASAFLGRELDEAMLLRRPKAHVPMVEEISLPESIVVRITDEGGVTVIGVPIGRRVRAGASNGSTEGWGRGPPCALPW